MNFGAGFTMIGKRYELARFQSDFYYHQYHKMLRRVNIVSVVILLLVLGIIYYLLHPALPRYYASTTTGQIIAMVPAG
jgi:hypothetical protein